MKKLISMTDFVLEQNKETRLAYETLKLINNYANFLKQPLESWMFVPCDEDGNVLEVNEYLKFNGKYSDLEIILRKHEEANKRCLFEGFSEKDANNAIFANENIEDLIEFDLTLTKTAIKQIES